VCCAAPEVILGQPYGKAVDMWSLGIILFTLLCGYTPFSDPNQRVLFRKIKKGEYEFQEQDWGDISAEAKDLVTKLLNTDPATRYTADDALKHIWVSEVKKE
jgi:calcium/calmodulin-dependent protein kinase I